jgi:protein translocase SecG subunit
MELLAQALPWIQIVSAVMLSALILLQRSGAELGGAFGGGDTGGGTAYARRGFERVMFGSTIGLAIVFVLANFAALVFPVTA